MISEYFNLQKRYQALYGDRTAVLMEVGSFYECWEFDPSYCASDEDNKDDKGNVCTEAIGHAIDLSVILNCVLTFENSSKPYSWISCHKVGFPVISWDKNKFTILANDYVIIRVDQIKGTKNPVQRHVTEICSPTMELDNIVTTRATSNIACIYIEYQQGTKNIYEDFLITTGVAVLDVITGHNRVCEFYSKVDDQVHAIQEMYRFLISHYPRELIIHISDLPKGLDTHTDDKPNPYVLYLEKVLELRRFDRLTILVNQVQPDLKKMSYQIEFLNQMFNRKEPVTKAGNGIKLNIIQKRNDSIISDIQLERMNYGRIAYILLMKHCHSHNPDIISKLSKPDHQWIDENRHLILSHNASTQLDIISPNQQQIKTRKNNKSKIDSLMSVLDHTQTLLGRRVLSALLQNPLINGDEITTYYDMVDEMSTKVENDCLWVVLDRQLKTLPDIGRLQRKLEIKLITPKELAVLYRAYTHIITIYVGIMTLSTPVLHKQMFDKSDIDSFNEYMCRFGSIINLEALDGCNINTSAESNDKFIEFNDWPLKSGVYPDLDADIQALINGETQLQHIVDHLNTFITHTTGKKIEYKAAKKKQGAKKQDPTGTLLATTTSKAEAIKAANPDTRLCGIIQILPYTTSDRIISSDKIRNLCTQIDTIKSKLRFSLMTIYDAIIEEMITKYKFYVPVASFIAKLDLVHSYAKSAHLYNYYRPEVVKGECSYFEVKQIRHPIIERIIEGTYVTNDLILGAGYKSHSETGSSHSNGILIFGTNATGKTSLCAASALIIIMAQIGCFVPGYLKFIPYSKIITRLTGEGNIFKGQSSFIVEMSELRTILRQADNRTLVIGDELAVGTENQSGLAICGSAIMSLMTSRSTFMFATHMHDLIELEDIKSLKVDQLRVGHLSISYDEESKILIYDRKLKSGPGASIYGLIVARSLNMPEEFLNRANKMLLEITGQDKEFVTTKTSRFCKDIYMKECAKCYKTSKQTELQSHHIVEQNMFKKGLVPNLRMNAKDNIIVLCRDCHTALHSSGIELETVSSLGQSIIRVKSKLLPECDNEQLITTI